MFVYTPRGKFNLINFLFADSTERRQCFLRGSSKKQLKTFTQSNQWDRAEARLCGPVCQPAPRAAPPVHQEDSQVGQR